MAASKVPLAEVNKYFSKAASDLRPAAAGRPSYSQAASELTYLASLPDSGDTAAQVAQSRVDAKALDSFFGTPNGG